MTNSRLWNSVVTLMVMTTSFVIAPGISSATTILDFSKFNTTPLTVSHNGTSHQTTMDTLSPYQVTISNGVASGMDGTAYLFLVGVQSTNVPDAVGQTQDGFAGRFIFSKANTLVNATVGANLILQVDVGNAVFDLSSSSGNFFASNGLGQTLTLQSAYATFSGNQTFTMEFSGITPPSQFTNPDQSFGPINLEATGGATAGLVVAVPEPFTLATAGLGILIAVQALRRQPRRLHENS